MKRHFRAELLDAPDHDPVELAESLEQVTAVNRRLGGVRALRHHLRPLLEEPAVRILDVGTGNGDVLRDILGWSERRGRKAWYGVGLDSSALVASVAASRNRQPIAGARGKRGQMASHVQVVQGDGLRLPFPDDTFDVVVATLTLHHFGPLEALALLGEMRRVSRGRVVVGDLERSPLNYLGARLLALTWWRRNRLTRHDGPLSVLRSFTADELLDLGREAGLVGASVVRHVPFRLILVGGVAP